MPTRFLTPTLLYVVALGVRLLIVGDHADPAYPDSFYYVDVARQLADGNGFSIDFVGLFSEVGGTIPADPILPIASNAYWMPLASLVQIPFIWLLGPTAFASALPFALVGALAAPLTWALARDAGARDIVAVGAALLVAVPFSMAPFYAQPDNLSLYQPLVVGALWATVRGLRGSPRAFILAGLLAALATLSRGDGVLVGVAVGLVFVWDRWRAWRSGGEHLPRIPLRAAAGCIGIFLLVVAPWFVRQLVVFGDLSPATASGKVLFMRDISELNSIDTPGSLDWLLGQGVGSLILSRVGAFIRAAGIFATLILGGLMLPFFGLGAWRRRHSADFGPFFAYAAILFAFSGLVSAVFVGNGAFLHSAVALAPYSYVLAVEGIFIAVAWGAARRPTWDIDSVGRAFVGIAVAFAVAVAFFATIGLHGQWNRERDERMAVAAALAEAGASSQDRVMSIDPAGYRYYTGHGGVVLVNDPLETVEAVARAYDVTWLALESEELVSSVVSIIDGNRPSWVGPPILELPGRGGGSRPSVALYPVCLDAVDPRCVG